MKKWLEFRAKTIRDFMVKARAAVKGVNPDLKFGVYVGGWYSTYYDVGSTGPVRTIPWPRNSHGRRPSIRTTATPT